MVDTNKINIMNIGTLNLCLGLKNKKLEIENLLSHNNISILCMQEVEIETNFDQEMLNIKDYNFELEVNSLNWLNFSFGTYKIRCKSLFLSF